jgi:acyl-CoA thioester hydrolase
MPLYSIAPVSYFPFVVRERVRLRDIDAFGHVNNAVYSTYLEQARLEALGELGSVILARVEIDFRVEIRLGDEVEVHSRCSRIGTKSFDLEHEIRAGDRIAAEAKSVIVGFDYETRRSAPLSDELKARLNGSRASA